MPISYALAGMLLIVIIGYAAGATSRRRLEMRVTELATALGFEVMWGVDAVPWMKPEAERQAAREMYEKLPEAVRRWTDRSVKRSAANYYCLVGTVDGVHVAIYRQTGKSTHNTVIRADYPKPLPFNLYIAPQGNALEHALFGGHDIEIGDETFDRLARVNAGDEAGARAVLERPGAREALLGLFAVSGATSASNVCAKWMGARGDDLCPATTRERIAAVVAVARTVSDG